MVAIPEPCNYCKEVTLILFPEPFKELTQKYPQPFVARGWSLHGSFGWRVDQATGQVVNGLVCLEGPIGASLGLPPLPQRPRNERIPVRVASDIWVLQLCSVGDKPVGPSPSQSTVC